MGVRHDLGEAEAAHLGADRLHVLVEAGLADGGRATVVADASDQCGAVGRRVALRDHGLDGVRPELRDLAGGKTERAGDAHDLALAHGNAREHLVEIFADADLHEERLGLPEFSGFGQARCVGAEFANTFGIGGEPSEAVGGMLLGLKLLRRDLPIGGENLRANAAGRLGDEGLSSFAGAPGEGQEILRFGGDGRGSGHGSNLSNQNEGWRSL